MGRSGERKGVGDTVKSRTMQQVCDTIARHLGWDGDPNHCHMCNSQINMDDFVDGLSAREFEISGMCQKCQDDFFRGGDDE